MIRERYLLLPAEKDNLPEPNPDLDVLDALRELKRLQLDLVYGPMEIDAVPEARKEDPS